MFLTTTALSQEGGGQIPPVHPPYPALTLVGSDAYFGGTSYRAVDGCWFLDGEFGFAIAMALSESRIEIHGASGVTTVESQGMTLQEVIDVIADGSATNQPSLPCSANEQFCSCSVTSSQACDGIAFQSQRCCPVAEFCGCLPIHGSAGCILRVKATCAPATSAE